jgi:hypothetical protein
MSQYYDKMEQFVLTVGTSEVAFPAPGRNVPNPEAIFVQSDDANTDKIFIGKAGVLANNTTGAFKFSAGDNGILPYNGDEFLKAISGTAGQILFVTYLSN